MSALAEVWNAITSALMLRPEATWIAALGVFLLAVVSHHIGRGIVLAINRVRRWRLAFTLTAAAIGTGASYLLLAVGVWLTGLLITGQAPGLPWLATSVMLTAAPLVFGFLVFLPYTGPAVERFLAVWGSVILWVQIRDGYAAGPWTSALITFSATGVMMLGSNLLGKPFAWLRDRVWEMATGEPLLVSSRQILEDFPA